MSTMAEYRLVKHLHNVIDKNMPNWYMQDSVSSINLLKANSFKLSHVLDSYDVESLYANIPMQETI